MTRGLHGFSATARARTTRGFGLVAVLVMCVGLLRACDTATPVLTGTVHVGDFGTPALNVPIRVYSDTAEALVAESKVDGHGTFRFTTDELAPGTYRVRVGPQWWSSTTTPSSWAEAESLVVDGDGPTDISGDLDPVGHVAGRLLFPDTTPADGVVVLAVRMSDNLPVGVDTTGTDGRFDIDLWDPSDVKLFFADPAGRFAPQLIGNEEYGVFTPSDGTDTGSWDVTDGGAARLTFATVDAAGAHSCGTDTLDHNVYCWGQDFERTNIGSGPYVDVKAGGSIDGGTFACALRATGTVDCDGEASYGETSPPNKSMSAIDIEDRTVCGLVTGGASIDCWGLIADGGDDLVLDAPEGETFVSVAAGLWHVCGLTDTGSVACAGDDGLHQYLTVPEGTVMTHISAGDFHTCGIDSDRHLVCSGYDNDGQATPPSGTFSQVDAGGYAACAVATSTGAISCWGNPDDGKTTPPLGEYVSVSMGSTHACAVDESHLVECWGQNDQFQSFPPYTW